MDAAAKLKLEAEDREIVAVERLRRLVVAVGRCPGHGLGPEVEAQYYAAAAWLEARDVNTGRAADV